MSAKTKYIFEIGLIVIAFLALGVSIGLISSLVVK